MELRTPMPKEPYNGKSPQGWKAPDGSTVYIGNLDFAVEEMELARAIEEVDCLKMLISCTSRIRYLL